MFGTSHTHHDHDSHDHGHAHGHNHGIGGHCHTPKVSESNRWRVGLAAIITGAFMVVEGVGGLLSGSLALLADAGHMFTDFAALSMAWAAFRLAMRPADARYSYGYDRISILVAFVNGLTLFAVAIWIVWEAFHRLQTPGEILAGPMLWVAIAGLIVNLVVFWVLLGADQENLNIRGAILHVLGDLLGSVAAIAAALIILATGWVIADPILSVLVALLILRSAWGLMKDSGHILLQGVPKALDVGEIEAELVNHIEGLIRVENIRLWSLTQERPIITLTAYINGTVVIGPVSDAIKSRLSDKFHIEDATVVLMPDA